MDFTSFLIIYFGFTVCLIGLLLFGEAPFFANTPVAKAHWLLTRGWMEGLEWIVSKTCGDRGTQFLDGAAECCCERSNPVLQFAYLFIVGAGYYLYWEYVFKLMPNQWAPIYHIFTGTAAVCLAVGTFLMASASDPGRITAANVAGYLAAYPPDGLLFPAKECSTCGFERPGRSKHCGVCGSCVARLDHHCGWINACVGLCNTRHFLLFLAVNCLLSVYASALCAMVVWGDLSKRGVMDLWVYDAKLEKPVPLTHKPARLVEYVVVYYGIAAALGVFGAMCAALLFGFLAYQCWLIATGTTTYESAKRQELEGSFAARAAAAADLGGSGGGGSEARGGGPGEEQRRLTRAQLWPHHRGSIWANFQEVLFPGRFLRKQQEKAEQERRQQQRQPLDSGKGSGEVCGGSAAGGAPLHRVKKRL